MARRKKLIWLRAWGRWGVYFCALMLLILVTLSIWVEPEIGWRGWGGPDQAREFYIVSISNTRALVRHNAKPAYGMDCFGVLPAPDPISVRFIPKYTTLNWSVLARPVWISINAMGPTDLFGIPLIYPTVMMLGWSIWLVRGRQKLRNQVGCCIDCGYSLEGLNGDVCPECGATHGEA